LFSDDKLNKDTINVYRQQYKGSSDEPVSKLKQETVSTDQNNNKSFFIQ